MPSFTVLCFWVSLSCSYQKASTALVFPHESEDMEEAALVNADEDRKKRKAEQLMQASTLFQPTWTMKSPLSTNCGKQWYLGRLQAAVSLLSHISFRIWEGVAQVSGNGVTWGKRG